MTSKRNPPDDWISRHPETLLWHFRESLRAQRRRLEVPPEFRQLQAELDEVTRITRPQFHVPSLRIDAVAGSAPLSSLPAPPTKRRRAKKAL